MVFKPFTHLARQSFGKTLPHGYAQSVVAATQSSSASSTTPLVPFGNHAATRIGRPQSAQLHTAFQNASGSSEIATAPVYATSETVESNNVLITCIEAWTQHRQEGKPWSQYQFPKRIGWEAHSVAPDGNGTENVAFETPPVVPLSRGGSDRAYSTSAIDDIKRAENEVAEAAAVAKINEAIAEEITNIQQPPASKDELHSFEDSKVQEESAKHMLMDIGRSKTPIPVSPVITAENSVHSTPVSDVTAATSVQETNSQAFSEHIANLLETKSFAQIPPAFESMLVRGLRPSINAYNALLASAVHLSIAKHLIVPKALDIYSDMLHRKVNPDTAFYTTLIQILSRRALGVSEMKLVLNQKRMRFGGMDEDGNFLFASSEAEYKILAEDDAISNAVKIFANSISHEDRHYSPETYELLVKACAVHGQIEGMVGAYTHMESHKVMPIASTFPPMIEAFAKAGDLKNAVECYNEYKSLAIADDAGQRAIIGRRDNDVYAAVVKAYAICGKTDDGQRFFGKIVDSYAETTTEHRKERLELVQNAIILNGLVEERIGACDFLGALKLAEERSLTPYARGQAMSKICTSAADHGEVDMASKAYQYLSSSTQELPTAVLAMLAVHTRQGKLDIASDYWALLSTPPMVERFTVEPITLYAVAQIMSGRVDEGLMTARESFARIRASAGVDSSPAEITEEIDEAIEYLGASFARSGIKPSANARMNFLWAMIDNGGLVSPTAEQMLAGLSHDDITSLSWQDMILALQIEAGFLGNCRSLADVTRSARFGYLLDIAINSGIPVDKRTSNLIEKALGTLSFERKDLVNKWHAYQKLPTEQIHSHPIFASQSGLAVFSTVSDADSYDPYAATTDYRGSTIISEELENRRNNAGLNEALLRFRNVRRSGRHPRYIVYAKLISVAAKEGRTNLIHDILGMARHDMPFLPQYRVVRHGWSSILDSMVGACLTSGRRTLAAQFHQEMLDMGTAPSANTFGLYITTLKESTKSFDEASEAVAIFGRAVSEGVIPSSFLYNALIGKLGKARRIDDCLRYFQEMRAAGIRPTSVTYGTVVNALCRVSDDRFAEELFDEMESMPNYKPRPAPYNSLMQFFLTTRRDSKKVLSYYNRMQARNIQPTMHTYKLLIDTYATLEPINLIAAEGVLDTIRASGQHPEAVHYASLIHARGCVLHDMVGARKTFDEVLEDSEIRPQACLYQALFESIVANHCVSQTEEVLESMSANRVEITPYIANTLIHGWAMENTIAKSKAIYDSVGMEKREPSTYEAMTRAFLTADDRDSALATVHEMLSRGYPSAVSSKILELVGHGIGRAGSVVLSALMA